MNGWQPIETAPKDGTVVDLWNKNADRRVCNCLWLTSAQVDSRYEVGGPWESCAMVGWRTHPKDDSVLLESQFSHWRLVSEDRPA